MSSNNSVSCPTPFVPDTDYPNSKGYVAGRFCGLNPSGTGTKCCLPCPIQNWVYSDDFVSHLQTANWLGVASFSLICFLLISYLVLPPSKSGRHYLTIGTAIAVMFQTLGLFIPLGTKPDLCYDSITPNWQATDNSCAWSGALLSLGSVGVAYWVMLRAIWLNIRVCWDKDPGKWFMIFAIATGIALPVLFTALSVSITGVAYRVGMTCLPNHEHAMETLWVWQIIFSVASIVIQLGTTSYCIYVYVRVLMQSRGQNLSSNSYGQSAQQKPQTAWRRLRQLLLLQWRTITLTLIVTIETLYFVLTFWAQDRRFGEVNTAVTTASAVRTWSACLVLSQGNKNDCIQYTNKIRLPESSVLGSLILLGLIGMQHFILLTQPRLFKGWWHLIKTHSFRRRGSDVPLTSLLPQNARSQLESGTSALRSPTPNTGGNSGKIGNDTGVNRDVSPASKTNANVTTAEQMLPKTSNWTTTTPTTATTNTAYLSTNTTSTTPKSPATSLNLSSRPSFFPHRASSHTRSPSRGGAIARSLVNTPTHPPDAYDEFDSDDVYGPDGVHAPPRTISHPYGFALPSERATTITDPAERRRLARSGDIVDFDFQQYDHDVRNSRSIADSFDEAARGNLRDSGSSFGASGIALGISLPPDGVGLGTGPWNMPAAAAQAAGRSLAYEERRGACTPDISNPLPLKNHSDYYAAFSSATGDWDCHRPSTPPPPPLPLNFSRRGRGNSPGFGRTERGGLGSATTPSSTGGMHKTAAGQRKASWTGSSSAVSSVGSSLGIGGSASKERDSVGTSSTGGSVSPFATGGWERVDPPTVDKHDVQVSDYAYVQAQQQQQQQQHHRRGSLLIALAPNTLPLPDLGNLSPPHSPMPGSRTPASRTALATPLKAKNQHPYGQGPPYEHNCNKPSISPFSFQAHHGQQRLFTPPDLSFPSNKASPSASALSTTSLSLTSSSSSLPTTPTPAAKTRSISKRATIAHASNPQSSGTSPASAKIELGRSATTAALPSWGQHGAGIANPHRLPSWARVTADTLGFKLSQPAVSEEGEELRDPQAIRDAVRDQGRGRGGLGMHPVSPEPSEPEDCDKKAAATVEGEAAASWRASRFGSGSSSSTSVADAYADAPEVARDAGHSKGSGFQGVGSRRWSGGSWVTGKRRSGESVFSSLSGLSASSATGATSKAQAHGQRVRKRSV